MQSTVNTVNSNKIKNSISKIGLQKCNKLAYKSVYN